MRNQHNTDNHLCIDTPHTYNVRVLDVQTLPRDPEAPKFPRWKFGSVSERLEAMRQMGLLPGEPAQQPATPASHAATGETSNVVVLARAKARKPTARSELPAHFPRTEKVILPEGCACPECAGVLRDLGTDEREVLEVVPVKLTVTRYVQVKKSCCRCAKVVQAPVQRENEIHAPALCGFSRHSGPDGGAKQESLASRECVAA